MLERILILLLLALAIGAIWGIARLWRAWTLRRLQGQAPLAEVVPPGRPAVVAFSTPFCAECRTRQAPALARLAAALGDQITIRTISALERADLAQRVGILTVPATVVVDANGAVQHLNLGYTSDARLGEQIRSIAGA